MTDTGEPTGLRGSIRRAVGEALDATVGRVGEAVEGAALEVTGATAQQVIEDLEPYLIEHAVPRIVDGVTPHLVASVVPVVVDGVTDHLVAVTVPQVVTDVTPRLVDDLLPRLLDQLRPYLEEELAPRIVTALLPRIESEVAPQVIDAVLPKIRDEVAPDLVSALMPTIESEVAPRLVEALLPMIESEVAPRVIDSVLPKIRAEVVPTILDDIVDDPRVRDLIREQSQGLLLDTLEAMRENLADGDDIVEGVARRLLRQKRRAVPQSGLQLVMDAASTGQAAPAITLGRLEEQRAAWRTMPAPPAPPGREFAHPGLVTRGIALAVDISLTGWLIGQGLAAVVSLLDSVFGSVPGWVTGALAFLAVWLVPIYLAVAWTWTGRSIGSWLVGIRVCTPDGRRLAPIRSFLRAVALVFLMVVWVMTGFVALFDAKRRTVLDLMLHTEERYLVPDTQQRRYLREALQERRDAELRANGSPAAK